MMHKIEVLRCWDDMTWDTDVIECPEAYGYIPDFTETIDKWVKEEYPNIIGYPEGLVFVSVYNYALGVDYDNI